MRDTQQRLPFKSHLHRPLNLLIRLRIQRRRRLITHNNLRTAHQRAGQGHELALAEGEVRAFFFDDVVEVDVAGFAARDGDFVFGYEGGFAEGGPELEVCVFGEGVEVGADGAFEEVGVLGDDGEAGAEVLETDLGDVLVVNYDGACGGCEVSMMLF